MNIGKLIQQPGGYKAFIPEKFPPDKKIIISTKTQLLHARAVLMLGKLDGITQLLPDLDFFNRPGQGSEISNHFVKSILNFKKSTE